MEPVLLCGSPVGSCFRVSVLARRRRRSEEGVETCGRTSRVAPGEQAAGQRASGRFADFRVSFVHLVSCRPKALVICARSDGVREKHKTRTHV